MQLECVHTFERNEIIYDLCNINLLLMFIIHVAVSNLMVVLHVLHNFCLSRKLRIGWDGATDLVDP